MIQKISAFQECCKLEISWKHLLISLNTFVSADGSPMAARSFTAASILACRIPNTFFDGSKASSSRHCKILQ